MPLIDNSLMVDILIDWILLHKKIDIISVFCRLNLSLSITKTVDTVQDKHTMRYVPENDAESTFGCESIFLSNLQCHVCYNNRCCHHFSFYKANLIPKVPLTEQQFMKININDPIEKEAADYEAMIRQKF